MENNSSLFNLPSDGLHFAEPTSSNIRSKLKVGHVVLAVLCNLYCITTQADTKTWLGAAGNWNEGSKWSPTGVPSAADVAIINGGQVFMTADASVGSLDLNGGLLRGGFHADCER